MLRQSSHQGFDISKYVWLCWLSLVFKTDSALPAYKHIVLQSVCCLVSAFFSCLYLLFSMFISLALNTFFCCSRYSSVIDIVFFCSRYIPLFSRSFFCSWCKKYIRNKSCRVKSKTPISTERCFSRYRAPHFAEISKRVAIAGFFSRGFFNGNIRVLKRKMFFDKAKLWNSFMGK